MLHLMRALSVFEFLHLRRDVSGGRDRYLQP